MFECCLHTLRVLLLRMGWVADADTVQYMPIIGENATLKCRGQVIRSHQEYNTALPWRKLATTKPVPPTRAEALMSADHKPVVHMTGMSCRLVGVQKGQLEALWASANHRPQDLVLSSLPMSTLLPTPLANLLKGFGDKAKIFDGDDRIIARLPGPPYKFIDRIVRLDNCEPWVLKPGAIAEAEYDVPPDEWYFHSYPQGGTPFMPFAVLLEVAPAALWLARCLFGLSPDQ